MFYGLTYLGVVHTLISLVAVAAAVIAFMRDGKITWDNTIGKTYVVTTILVCLTGFGIFQHGGFGKAHALGVITLLTLAVIYLAAQKKLGKFSTYIETVGYSLTFFFHIVPAVTETATRLPLDAPLAASPEDPGIQKVIGICFVLFLIGAVLQVKKLRANTQTVL